MQEATGVEKINSGINIFIIYNFLTHWSCSACQRERTKMAVLSPVWQKCLMGGLSHAGQPQEFLVWVVYKEVLAAPQEDPNTPGNRASLPLQPASALGLPPAGQQPLSSPGNQSSLCVQTPATAPSWTGDTGRGALPGSECCKLASQSYIQSLPGWEPQEPAPAAQPWLSAGSPKSPGVSHMGKQRAVMGSTAWRGQNVP